MGFLHKIKRGGAETQIAIGVVMIFLVGILAIGAAAAGYPTDFGDPAISTTENGEGGVTCATWTGAADGYQADITRAANKVGIQPALLGAVFLSEHDGIWPNSEDDPGSDGVWAQGGDGQGPFQIETWSTYWQQVEAKGYNDGRTISQVSVENMYDSGVTIAVSILVGLEKYSINPLTTEQKYIYYVGLRHNGGPGPAQEWADAGFDINNPPGIGWGTDDYAKRTWENFNKLNKDCDVLDIISTIALPSSCDAGYTGTPNSSGFIQIPAKYPEQNPYYTRYSSAPRTWGTPELTNVIISVAKRWQELHPNDPNLKFQVGEASLEHGGKMPPHVSHQTGQDVDIFVKNAMIIIKDSQGKKIVNPNYNKNYAIELAELFISCGNVTKVGFLDIDVKAEVDKYAISNHLPGRIYLWAGHKDHFHVRINY